MAHIPLKTHAFSAARKKRSEGAITKLNELVKSGLISSKDADQLGEVEQKFRIRLTDEMRDAAQQSAGIAHQFIPTQQELITQKDELYDPIGDDAHTPTKGLTHRYPDRVILHITKTCEVYCRFCFRRESVGKSGSLSDDDLFKAINYIAQNPDICEVILTGGDPLTLSARRIQETIKKLEVIAHIETIRIHTRVPVVAPDKVTDTLIDALRSRLSCWVVLHINHPDELTKNAQDAIKKLSQNGVGLLSQSVLLRGINNDVFVLEKLFRALYRLHIKPYYLHHCDLAKGTSHFRTTIAEGQKLMQMLQGRLSGPCIPKYVIDIPGGYGKVPIGSQYTRHICDTQWNITDWQGNEHIYHE